MSQTSCVVLDYGIGNVFSVMQALQKIGANPILTSDLATIRQADRMIVPGVGAFNKAVNRLKHLGMDEAILEFVATERPMLGICVGMQLLMEKGMEFGETKGLGLFKGTVEQIQAKDHDGQDLRVPVIGWNTLNRPSSRTWNGSVLAETSDTSAYYFVHSFAVNAQNSEDILATTTVGADSVVSAIARDNIIGVQFHPERSSHDGLKLLKSFTQM